MRQRKFKLQNLQAVKKKDGKEKKKHMQLRVAKTKAKTEDDKFWSFGLLSGGRVSNIGQEGDSAICVMHDHGRASSLELGQLSPLTASISPPLGMQKTNFGAPALS